jgi:alkylhydroperoxidase/carboxymuconolactone decarboxylase family protein YurZ
LEDRAETGQDDAMDTPVTRADVRSVALAALADVGDGLPLDAGERALVDFGLAVSVTSLDRAAIGQRIASAYDAGASAQQIQEIASLVSGLGVHSLMASAAEIYSEGVRRGGMTGGPLTADQQRLWQHHVGDDPFWVAFEREVPGFLQAMLRLSPEQFSAFFDYCAVPWKSGTVSARLKEIVAMAVDATPAHMFLPGFRLHLSNAIMLGAGRLAILEALDLAAGAPPHPGTR